MSWESSGILLKSCWEFIGSLLGVVENLMGVCWECAGSLLEVSGSMLKVRLGDRWDLLRVC